MFNKISKTPDKSTDKNLRLLKTNYNRSFTFYVVL